MKKRAKRRRSTNPLTSEVKQNQRPTKGRRGAPSLFTRPRIKRILNAIQLGAAYEHAAAAGGVSYAAFRNWMRTAENKLKEYEIEIDDPDAIPTALKGDPYIQFFIAVHEADAKGALVNLGIIRQAVKGCGDEKPDAKLALEILKHRHPRLYGRQIQEHSGPEGGPIPTQAIPPDPPMIARNAMKSLLETCFHCREKLQGHVKCESGKKPRPFTPKEARTALKDLGLDDQDLEVAE